jgi:hypothetical protein
VIFIRDKFAQDLDNGEMIHEFNRLFDDHVNECEKMNQCVDHHGFQDSFLLLVVHLPSVFLGTPLPGPDLPPAGDIPYTV